ncbi:MAG: shikimate dehydrogenase [Chthoniobacterales bacterium]
MKEVYTFADLQNWPGAAGEQNSPVRLGIFGDPIEHSRSPQMQNAAMEACDLPMRYARFHIRSGELGPALGLLPALDFIGVNLTVPHKIAGAAAMDRLDEFARQVGAVNTVQVAGDRLLGSNTDGPGFARAIRSEFSVDLRDLRVLLLGAGGAGRAIAMQCAVEGCERLVLANRTPEKAQELADELRPHFRDARVAGPVARLEAVPWDERSLRLQIANTDLLVNATSVGLRRSDPPLLTAALLVPHLMVYDTVYGPHRTGMLRAAAEAGARGANGLSMLLHQGALAFETWFDRDAPLEAMQSSL